MDLVDLYPDTQIYTRIGDLIFKLRLFDLHAVVWAEYAFSESDRGGLNAMFYHLNNPDNWDPFSFAVADLAFYLAENLKIKSKEEFVKKINESNEKKTISRNIAILNDSIQKVLKKSFPDKSGVSVSGGEIFNNIVKNEQPEPTNWAKVYADFYRIGGMTRNEFFSMTVRQISEIYSQIDEGRTREKIESMQFNCGIHGIKKENWPKMPQKRTTKTIDEDEIKRRQEEHEKLFKRTENGTGSSN
jgi:DUF438 domain-containing protein